jgi:alkanesulfonate monooxygenase SsuD/methylene tetrahydromethanopterin reductase-like flavin-dependent oxidoreductase (luciferase family)
VSVIVLSIHQPIHVAHQIATLDYLSNGRAVLGVGLGRNHHYTQFQVPREQRVRRFRESVELIRALWTESEVNYHGSIFQLDGAMMAPKPVQKPRPPIWFGGGHPDAIRRAATIADGWMGPGGSSMAAFARNVSLLKVELERVRVIRRRSRSRSGCFFRCTSVPTLRAPSFTRWFSTVYHNPEGTDASGIHGTPEQVRARIEELIATGVNHLLLNPVCRYGRTT